MTLNITGTAFGSVVQVTDRLVTRQRAQDKFERFDPAANKNVVFLARNGLLAIGYTGLAYVEDQPTDRWIARKLALDETLQDDGLGSIRAGHHPGRWMDIGSAMRHLADEFTRAWRRSAYGIGGMQVIAAGFQWPATGWSWKLGRSRPVIWQIMCRASKPEFGAVPVERYFGWERGLVRVGVLPSSWLPEDAFRSLETDLTSAESPEAIIDGMVRAVRVAASQHDVVGPDCMSIHLPSPRLSRMVTCRWVPQDEGAGSPFAFTPWVVAPDTKLAPTLLNGFNLEVSSGPFDFKIEGDFREPHLAEDGSLFVFQSQPRPPFPSR